MRRLLLCSLLVGSVGPLSAATFQGIGDLPGGLIYSRALAVSDDGNVVVGESESAFGGEAFRWQDGYLVGLGDFAEGDFISNATAVNADGSIVAGWGTGAGNARQAARWTEGGMEGLGDLLGGTSSSSAEAISADGTIVVGQSLSTLGNEGFRWQDEELVGLGLPDDVIAMTTADISADGSVIVGFAHVSGGNKGFRLEGGSLTILEDCCNSVANAISPDGSVIVGYMTGPRPQGFRWDDDVVSLLSDGGDATFVLDVSLAGSTIVGYRQIEPSFELDALIWKEDLNPVSLQDHLLDEGVASLSGWQLEVATGVSADGNVIVGWGTNPAGQDEAWIVDLVAVPEPSSLTITMYLVLLVIAARCSVPSRE